MEVYESRQTSVEVKLRQALFETLKGLCHAICCFFENQERFLPQLIPKIMTHFCYLRLYLGLFQVLIYYAFKYHKNIFEVSAP